MNHSGLVVAAVAVATAALLAPACSRDQEAAKRDHLQKGDQYLNDKRFAEAIIEYRNVIQVDPKSGEARRKLADAYLQSGDVANGYREYVRAADLLPLDNDVQLTAGGLRLMARQFEDARSAADKVLAREPSNVRALVLRGNAIAGLKNLDEAVRDIEQAIKLHPSGAELYTNLGGLEMQRNRAADAEAAFQKAVATDPQSAAAHSALGNFYWASNRAAEAEQAFKKAVALDPDDTWANRALAAFYLGTGRRADAEAPLQAMARTAQGLEARLVLADYYLLGGKPDEGIRILEALAKEKDGLVPANTRLAAAAYGAGRRDEAHQIVDGLLARNNRNPQALVLKARFLFVEKKTDEALDRAKAATAADPQSVQGFYLLGLIEAAKGHRDEATKAFNEVVQLNPRAAAAQLELSRLRLAAGDSASAVQFAEQAVRGAPRAGDARLALAQALLARGDIARAEVELAPLAKSYPDSAVVSVLRGHLFLKKKDYLQASRAYTQAYDANPRQLDALSGLIALDLLASKSEQARSRIEAHLAKGDRSGAAYLLAAKTYGVTRDLAKAEEMLRKALEVDPSNLEVYGALGQLYSGQGRLAEARTQFENVVKRDPQSVPANTMLALILNAQGQVDEAKARYEKVLSVDPRAAVAANNLAWLYAEKGEKLDVAQQLAQAAYAQMPGSPDVRDTLGWVFYKKGLWPQAIPLFEENVKADPQNPTYHYRLGVAQNGAGLLVSARQSLEQALKLNPAFADAADAKRVLAMLP